MPTCLLGWVTDSRPIPHLASHRTPFIVHSEPNGGTPHPTRTNAVSHRSQVEIQLCEVVSQRDGQIVQALNNRAGVRIPKGTVTINAEEIKSNARDRFFLQFSASKWVCV